MPDAAAQTTYRAAQTAARAIIFLSTQNRVKKIWRHGDGVESEFLSIVLTLKALRAGLLINRRQLFRREKESPCIFEGIDKRNTKEKQDDGDKDDIADDNGS